MTASMKALHTVARLAVPSVKRVSPRVASASRSQYERRLISQRTRDALAAKRARGERLGAAPALPMQITRRILTERRQGQTFQAIAERLMADAIPTARGKTRWYPATIKAVVTSDNAAALAVSGRPAPPVSHQRPPATDGSNPRRR